MNHVIFIPGKTDPEDLLTLFLSAAEKIRNNV